MLSIDFEPVLHIFLCTQIKHIIKMNDLTDIKQFLNSIFRPIIYEAIRDHLSAAQSTPVNVTDNDPYGDFKWLVATCPGVPASTLRIKSAAGEIPGVVKFGKRVLYEKAAVLEYLRSQTRQAPSRAAIEHAGGAAAKETTW